MFSCEHFSDFALLPLAAVVSATLLPPEQTQMLELGSRGSPASSEHHGPVLAMTPQFILPKQGHSDQLVSPKSHLVSETSSVDDLEPKDAL